jgi:peroxiredoxin
LDLPGRGAIMTPAMTLAQRLAEVTELSRTSVPPDQVAVVTRLLDGLAASGIAARACKKGDRAPTFALIDVAGLTVSSQALLDYGPLAVVFYRGGWCPYCNLELRAYQDMVQAIEDQRGTLVAISPETPDHMVTTRDANALTMQFLHDAGNRVARSFGLVYEIPEPLREPYLQLGADLALRHGDGRWELPIPATYVIDRTGRITLAYVNVDFRERLEPEAVVAELARLRLEEETGSGKRD